MLRAIAVVVAAVLALALEAAPTVTNVRASQRSGTKLVDIWFDVGNVSGGYAAASVAVEAGGSAVSATSLSGDLGGITAGSRCWRCASISSRRTTPRRTATTIWASAP